MSRDRQAATSVERHSVRARLGAAIRSSPFVTARLEEGAHARNRIPLMDAVAGDVGEIEAVFHPHRTFQPGEASGDALQHGVGRNNPIDGWIQPIHFERRRVINALGFGSSGIGPGGALRVHHYRHARNHNGHQDKQQERTFPIHSIFLYGPIRRSRDDLTPSTNILLTALCQENRSRDA